MFKPFNLNLQFHAAAETGVNFEDILRKHAGEDGSIIADAIPKAVHDISSAVGRAFVEKARYNAKLEEVETLKADKAAAEDKLTAAEKWQDKYTKEHEAFEKFKTDTEAKNRLADIKSAYKALLAEVGIDAKRHDAIIRATDFSDKKLGEDGKLEKADDLKKDIERDWSDFKVTTSTKGVPVETPPKNSGPAKRTKEEIINIKDAAERQQAIADNHELFGF